MNTEKDQFIQTWEREFQTTVKVLKSFPTNKLDLKPAEKSRSAKDLAWTFVAEEGIADMAMKGKIDFSGPTPKTPNTMQEILGAYEGTHKKNVEKLKNLSETDYNSPIGFPSGPGKMMDMRKADELWTMLMDMVHHRGQMSVYIRLAGGKVPSIYGPTADEPWM